MKSDTLSWHDQSSIARIIQALSESRVIAGTSDTVLGLLAPLTPQGFEHLNVIKGRFEKPYIILVRDIQVAKNFIDPLFQIGKFEHFWPGPLTLICRPRMGLPDFLISRENTIALRVPAHAGLQAILQRVEGLFSTSANKAGRPIPTHLSDIDSDIVAAVAYVVDEEGEGSVVPSTILDCTQETPRIVREGAYTRDLLKDVLR